MKEIIQQENINENNLNKPINEMENINKDNEAIKPLNETNENEIIDINITIK